MKAEEYEAVAASVQFPGDDLDRPLVKYVIPWNCENCDNPRSTNRKS